jgi:glucose/arabinose dehydrogenase
MASTHLQQVRRLWRLIGLTLAIAALIAVPAQAQTQLPPGFAETTAWKNLGTPTVIRFAPDGQVFIATKAGIVWRLDSVDDQNPKQFADLSAKVFDGWDRGMLGMALDPKFDEGRPYVYVAYAYDKKPGLMQTWNDQCDSPDDTGCAITGRVSRLDAAGNETVLLEDFCQQFISHSMGTLEFGPDGWLYGSAGDGASYGLADYGQRGNPCGDPPGAAGTSLRPPEAQGGALRAQSFRRPAGQNAVLNGAIVRIDPDTGAAAPGNPASASADPNRQRIVAFGFRNPFRFTFRPGTSELWVGDVGWNSYEEIDRVQDIAHVRNFGWPCYEGPSKAGSYDAQNLDSCETLYDEGGVNDP